ncbi:MAG: hypothetical protein JWQ71_4846 [Pedosphaera sp.]|nr:hypothetical protein [Pedosphaera sp.]
MRINPFYFTLAIHIVAGTVALLIAPLAMATVKGGRWHRRWGKIYFWAMAGVALTAGFMCWLRSGLFLFLIAIFSFYLALTGYRVLGRKKPEEDKPHSFDVCIAVAMVLAGAGLILLGVRDADARQRWVPIIFGAIGVFLGMMDIVRLRKPPRAKQAWMFLHMTRFLGAYVATVTAFSVVNFHFLPFYWRWLWPTAFGTFGITIWRTYYARKFKSQNHGIVQ